MGRGRHFICCLYLKFSHTYEYCERHNGFKPGGQPVRSGSKPNTPGGGPFFLTKPETPQ